MPKNVRRWVWAVLLLTCAALVALAGKPASACPSGWEGTWSGDCNGAARDCSVIFVCGSKPPV
jgi:hypothetical protein